MGWIVLRAGDPLRKDGPTVQVGCLAADYVTFALDDGTSFSLAADQWRAMVAYVGTWCDEDPAQAPTVCPGCERWSSTTGPDDPRPLLEHDFVNFPRHVGPVVPHLVTDNRTCQELAPAPLDTACVLPRGHAGRHTNNAEGWRP